MPRFSLWKKPRSFCPFLGVLIGSRPPWQLWLLEAARASQAHDRVPCVVHTGLLLLLTSDYDEEACPETLCLDLSRVSQFSTEIRHLVQVTMIGLLVDQALTQAKPRRADILAAVHDLSALKTVKLHLEMHHFWDSLVLILEPHLLEQVASLKKTLESALLPYTPLYNLVLMQLQTYLFSILNDRPVPLGNNIHKMFRFSMPRLQKVCCLFSLVACLSLTRWLVCSSQRFSIVSLASIWISMALCMTNSSSQTD